MKMKILLKVKVYLLFFAIVFLLAAGCREVPVPKPKGYFRIDLPEKQYTLFNDPTHRIAVPLSFEYPLYSKISGDQSNKSDPGWFNIEFPGYRARIYLTYKEVNDDLAALIEQTYTMNVKNHITKADAIDEMLINNSKEKVYGILYDLRGNTATAVQFYVTDSTRHYLRGSLYFESEPNADSLAPVIDFFREDVVHLIETLKWK